MKEFLKDYFITEDGEVFSGKSNIFMKKQTDRYGYYCITISLGNRKTKKYMIHRLVAQHYVENKFNKKCVNHIDGNKKNNNYSNLEWCTIKENNQHAFDIGLKKGSGGVKPKPVIAVNKSTGEITEYPSQRKAARETGVDQASIWRNCNRKVKYAGDYVWSYKEE